MYVLRMTLPTAVFALSSFSLLPAQAPPRSATVKVLEYLDLPDAEAPAARLREDKRRIKEQLVQIDGSYNLLSGDDRTLYFSQIYLSYYGLGHYVLPRTRTWLEKQRPDGFIAADEGTLDAPRPAAPFLAQIILLGSKQQNNFNWLRKAPGGEGFPYYERLKQYLDYWRLRRDADGNGLPAWDRTGADGLLPPAVLNPEGEKETPVESVALACLLHREYKAMALLAHQLRRPADVDTFHRRADALAEALNNNFWDENSGFYLDRVEASGKLSPLRSATGFLPLFAGIAPYERAERLVRDHLGQTDGFWTSFPLPLKAADTGAGRQEMVWIPLNYLVFQGLMDYGYHDLARSMAVRSFELAFRQNQHTRSYYESQSGTGRGQDYASWSSPAYLMPWEYELNYTPSTMSWQPLFPLVRDYLGVAW